MRQNWTRYHVALVFLLSFGLAACGGGGGGQSSSSSVLPAGPAPQQTTPPAEQGPVTYLQSTGPLSTSGTIAKGTQQALIAVMSGAPTPASAYAPDTLLVSGPPGASGSSTHIFAPASRAVAPPRVIAPEAFAADDSALLARMRGLAAVRPSTHVQKVRSQSTIPASPGIGATASIWVQQGPVSSHASQIPATLLVQTPHGNIWVDDSLNGTAAWSNAAQIGTNFENAYVSDTEHFASPDYSPSAPGLQVQYESCNSNGSSQGTAPGYVTEPADHRIDVMVVNADRLGGYGGYFSGANLMPQGSLNCLNSSGYSYESNEAPFIFVGWFSSQSADYELKEDLVRGTAHELQHLINFVNHAILASGASNAGFNGNESTYINEGLSMLAQDFAVQRMYGSQGLNFDADDALSRANAYLSDPGSFSITAFTGIDSGSWGGGGSPQYNCFGGCYGGAYLFQRYLRDRFGGDSYTHEIETSGVTGSQNLQTVTGESSGNLLDDFALAMAANTLGVTPSDQRFVFGSLGLTQSYVDQFGASRALVGVSSTPLSSGSAQVHAPIGGFAFVSVPSVPAAGLPVTVTDQASVTGFGLAGGLAQH